jgi:hypothetical protein
MGPPSKISAEDLTVNLGQDEVCRILDLKQNLTYSGVVEQCLSHYLQLGWSLVAMDARDGSDLGIDFSKHQGIWAAELADLGLQGIQINLGVRTGRPSQLIVLEVNKGEGALSLDQQGDWRAECVAAVGDCWEQHYYVLPAEGPFPASFFQAPQVLIYGDGGLALVPPSLEAQAREPWRWLQPPWEKPPHYPKPAVWQFLKKYLPSQQSIPEVPTWAEIYRLISPHDMLLKTLLVPAGSPEDYCQGILNAALGLGLKEPAILLGLLWHAPHLDWRNRPARWEYLKELVAGALEKAGEMAQLPDLPGRAGPFEGISLGTLPAMGPSEAGLSGVWKEAENSPPRFEQSVSGQFFQLLAGLGEKVIMESCRYEAILSGLGARAGELENLVAEWERCFSPTMPAGQNPGPPKSELSPIEFDWTSVINHQAVRKQQIQEVQAAARDFLEKNPDVAADRNKVQMVLFCLKNYVSINPEWAGMPFREKLERAGLMARGFLKERGGP